MRGMQRRLNRNVALAIGLIWLVSFSPGPAWAQVSEQVKPRILLVVDISGSMSSNVSGPAAESCSGGLTRFDHAKCAIQRLVEVNGDIDFALSQFRKNAISGDCANGCADDDAMCYASNLPNSDVNAVCYNSISISDGSVNCQPCDESDGTGCTPAMSSADQFQLLVPFTNTSAADIGSWVDFSCGGPGCSLDPASNPELTLGGWTPIGGALRGAKRFLQGNDPVYDEGSLTDLETYYGIAASTPIELDPYALVQGSQCRPYIVITLTDGEETCEKFSGTTGTTAAATALLSTTVGGFDYRVETRPIGFGFSAPAPTDDCTGASPSLACQIEAIANAGGANGDGLGDGTPSTADLEGLYAANEDDLFAAFNTIIADSIKVEVCNGIDDDCDGQIDEGYNVGDSCNDGGIGWCLDEGSIVCDVQSGLSYCNVVDDHPESSEPGEVCNGITDDCDVAIDEGLNCVVGCVEDQRNCSAPDDDCCDGFDNDCDGSTDEDAVTGQECGATDMGICEYGLTTCSAGQIGCSGEIGPSTELCNNMDEDCDGVPDNEAVCPGDTSCVEGGCRVPCDAGEFPCSFGFTCISDYCVPDPCTNCPADWSCVDNACVDLCINVSCDEGESCIDGSCYDCSVLGCPGEQLCFDGLCQADACENLDCGSENCVDGQCVPTCDSSQCPAGQLCTSAGQCAVDACAGNDCKGGEICVDGQCLPDPCSRSACRVGEVCVQGACEADRCLLTDCADGQECDHLNDGTPVCVPTNPTGPVDYVSPGGGRGCGVSPGSEQSASLLLFFMFMFLGFRRRQK